MAKKLKEKIETVVIAHLHPGQVSAFFHSSMVGTILYDRSNSQRIVGLINEWSSANVSAPRNKVTEKFLSDYDADWLFWIDSDMAWGHEALEQLIHSADKDKAPIVGGLCFGSADNKLFPTIYQLTSIDDNVTTARVHDYPDNAMVQVAATGAAFLLVHRTALEKIRDKAFNEVFPWFQETQLAGQPAGEDVTFCLRAGLCEIPVFVNTGVKVGHHKSHLLTHELFQQQNKIQES